MQRIGFFIIVALMSVVLLPEGLAQKQIGSAENVSAMSIVDHITADSVNTIVLPDGMLELLMFDERQAIDDKPKTSVKVGYRVQVFSDNNARTAKNEARSKSRNVSARFPQYRTYVMYASPYWRLRVGDFRTQEEAQVAAEELRKAFPAYSREIHVVRDRINAPVK